MKPRTFTDIPGWTFAVEEVSSNVYKVVGRDEFGRSVEITGTDPDELVERAHQDAKEMQQRIGH